MKQSPQEKKLEEILRSTKLVAGGFMGTDTRHPAEVVDDDCSRLEKLGLTAARVAARMRELTELAIPRLGGWIEAEPGKLRVKSEDFKGSLVCPWPHQGAYGKRITIAERMDIGKQLVWTDLNIHMIETHGFFEGKGAFFRVEPAEVAQILFEGLKTAQM
ncbi:MAG: hypothetical protein JW808_07685 [Victivallales bacterium]|nr:hypothetical protein [Victivallales bacterium]